MLPNSPEGLVRRASVPAKRAPPSSSASSNASSATAGLATVSPSPSPSAVTPSPSPPPGNPPAPAAHATGMTSPAPAPPSVPSKVPVTSPGGKGARKSGSTSAAALNRHSASPGSASGSKAAANASGPPVKKARKPYTISRQREIWTPAEHELFVAALKKYGRSWKQIESHVQTKSVIQIRSHAQKYFIKAQKNNSSELVPPPRPKRRSAPAIASQAQTAPDQSAASSAASASEAHMAAYAAAARQLAQSQQQMPMQTAAPAAGTNPQVPLSFPLNPLQPAVAAAIQQQMSLGAQSHAAPQSFHQQHEHQQRFAAAVQQNLQLLSFGGLHGAPNPFFSQHPIAPVHPINVANQHRQSPPAPRTNAAKAISPRLPDNHQSGPVGHINPTPVPSTPVHGNPLHPFPLMTPPSAPGSVAQHPLISFPGLIPQGPALGHGLQPGTPLQQVPNLGDPQTQLPQISSESTVAPTELAALSGAGPSGDAIVPPPETVHSLPVGRLTDLPVSVGERRSPTASAAAAAAAVAVSGGVSGPGTSPNFTRIYAFFASLLNPQAPFDEEEVLATVLSSTLDGEIIKLLVRNLEVNLASETFREQLTHTSQEQQANQEQHQHGVLPGVEHGHQYPQLEEMNESMRWLNGSADENG